MTKLNPLDVRDLEGWVPLADAADRMKLSPNGLRKRVFEYGEFGDDNVRKIRIGGNVIFLLRASKVDEAVEQELHEREVYQTKRLPQIERRKARQKQRREILEWAQTSGFAREGFPVPTMGRLSKALIDAYVAATGKRLVE